ncbi:CC033 protein, partial [Alcedo cyanopectus]|nr:CC033 protein [Ceyx cyanopectus]
RAERPSPAAEALSRLSEWADAHLGLLRSLSTGMAVAGVLVLARSVRLTTQFTSALDIPVEFVKKNVKLRGKFQQVTERGLEVEHIPISIPFTAWIQRKWQSRGVLLVRLAGVELAPSGLAWLQQELKPQQVVWFQLLGREDMVLECLVLVSKGGFLSRCLNEEILRQGLGRAARIEGLHHQAPLYWKLHRRLLRAELEASRKQRGIWREERAPGSMGMLLRRAQFLGMLKQLVSWWRGSVQR